MPRTVAYRAGGFTNCGISYTKFSQEELAEMKDRAMTEKEAIEVLKDFDKQVSAKADGAYQTNIGKMACDIAIKALEEVQQYRAIEKELKEHYHANIDIPLLMQHFIETIFEGEKHEGFCILTNEDAKAWEEYRTIGTPEECRAAVEKQKPKAVAEKTILSSVGEKVGKCPGCLREYLKEYDNPYCPECGQRLDWRANNETD